MNKALMLVIALAIALILCFALYIGLIIFCDGVNTIIKNSEENDNDK